MEDLKVTMEKEFISEKEISEAQLDAHVKENILKFLLRLGLIAFISILSIVTIYLLSRVDKKPLQKQSEIATISYQPSPSPQVGNPFETDKTRKATSLEVPPLYPDLEWIDTTEQSKNDGSNKASVYEELIDVPFKGRYWSSTSSLDHNDVESYFVDRLNKLGWVGWGGENSYLEFNSFKLAGIIADAACAGGRGALGYKDGFVRLVTIQFSSYPCHPPGWPDVTPYPSNKKFYTDYTIFISDPMPIEEIGKYVKPSSASRS